MAKKSTSAEMEKRETGSVPDYVEKQDGQRSGFEEMKPGDILTPALTIIQKAHDEELITKYGMGSLVLLASDEKLCGVGELIKIQALKHYVDYVEWDSTDETRKKPALARSTDRLGDLAKRFEDGEKVVRPDGKVKFAVTASHRFICLLEGRNYPVMLSFRNTNYKNGKAWLNMMYFRGNFPMYAGKYTLRSVKLQNAAAQEYYVLRAENDGWATKEEYDVAASWHDKVKDIGAVRIEGDDEQTDEVKDTTPEI